MNTAHKDETISIAQIFDISTAVVIQQKEDAFLAFIMSRCSTRPELSTLVRQFCAEHGIAKGAELDRLEGV